MRRSARTVLFASLLLSVASVAVAQRVPERRGVWFGAGVGVGSARLSCSICRGGRDGGASGYLRLGATVSQRVLVGGEALAWYHTQGSIDFLLGSVQAVVYLYPKKGSGFYIKSGMGVAQYTAKDNDDKVSSQALAGQIGVGYEVLVAHNLSLVPYANFLGTSGADVRFNDTVSGLSANTSLIQVGVGITLH